MGFSLCKCRHFSSLQNLFFLSQVEHWSVSLLHAAHIHGKLFFGYVLTCPVFYLGTEISSFISGSCPDRVTANGPWQSLMLIFHTLESIRLRWGQIPYLLMQLMFPPFTSQACICKSKNEAIKHIFSTTPDKLANDQAAQACVMLLDLYVSFVLQDRTCGWNFCSEFFSDFPRMHWLRTIFSRVYCGFGCIIDEQWS